MSSKLSERACLKKKKKDGEGLGSMLTSGAHTLHFGREIISLMHVVLTILGRAKQFNKTDIDMQKAQGL